MVDGASFWAKGSSQVKSAAIPTPSSTQPPKSTQPPSSKGLVLKAISNGATNGTTNGIAKQSISHGRKLDWADEEGDEDFYASFGVKQAKPDPRFATLEASVALKNERIDDLELKLASQNVRVSELEDIVEQKNSDIADLEAEATQIGLKIEELEKANHKQYLQLQELIAEVDEKDRRFAALDAKLEEERTIAHNLEVDSNPESPSESPIADEFTQVENAIERAEGVTDKIDSMVIDNGDSLDIPVSREETITINTLSSDETTVAAQDFSPEELSVSTSSETRSPAKNKKKNQSGPLFNNAEFPVFLTAETIKVVPPPPMPKKMVFPKDNFFSKLNSKPTQPTDKVFTSSRAKGRSNTSWGQVSKEVRAETDQMPTFSPSLDIRTMNHTKRILYANGPEVEVKMGDIHIATLPKYILMQCSGKVLKYFTENPKATDITFPAASMDVEAAIIHCTWMDEMTYQGRVYSVTLNTDPKFDTKNVQICRAARVMGLNNTYVGHFTRHFCDRIRAQQASDEFADLVCALAYPDNDPVFDCLANNMVNQLRHNFDGTKDLVAALTAKYEVLKKKMEQIEKRLGGKRQTGKPHATNVHDKENAKEKNKSIVR